MTVKEAVHHAMQNEEQAFSQTHWADSYSSVNRFNHSWQFTRFGNRLVYSREIDINAQ